MTNKSIWFWTTFLAWLAIDQASKIWVYTNLEYRVDEIQIIPGFLSIVHAQNPGAAFGMLVDFEHRHLVFLAFTVAAIFVVADMFRKLPSSDRMLSCALGLILSGTVGNAIDRIHKRTVTDFIRVLFGSYEYPSFNIADSTLLVGVVMFMLHAMFADGGEPEPAAPTAEATGDKPTPHPDA